MEPKENNAVFSKSLTKTTTKHSSFSYIIAGQISSTHGLKGELLLNVFDASLKNLLSSKLKEKAVQIRRNDKILFEGFLHRVRSHKKRGLIIQLKDVPSFSAAKSLKNTSLWIKKSLFLSDLGENIYLCEVLGFKVYDKNYGFIGEISGFSNNGAQDIIIVQKESSGLKMDILFIPELITKIDFKKNSLILNLPSGWPGF